MAFSLLQKKIFNAGAKFFDKNTITGSSVCVLNLFNDNSHEIRQVHTIFLPVSRVNQHPTNKTAVPIIPATIPHHSTVSHTKSIPTLCKGNFCLLNKQQSRHLSSGEFYSPKKTSKPKLDHEFESDSDSDADEIYERDHPKGKEKGDSEFWRRKMRTLHGVLDVNNDGVVSFEDFMLLAHKFTDLGHLGQKTSEEFYDIIKKTWEEQWGEISQYNLITAEQFLSDMHHALNDKALSKHVGSFLPYLFKAVDIDRSGYLDLDQYKLFFKCLGLTEEDAAVSFAVIDKNGDGKLALKEFVKYGKEFFLTEDERRVSRMFWGPLVNH